MAAPTTEVMHGTAGIKDGKLYLSQGVTRALGSGDGGKFTEIPVIDLSAMINPRASEEEKNQLISSIRDACTRVGFFVIKNHGIDWDIVEDSFSALEEFFGLPMEKKMEVHQNRSPSYMGYEQPYYTNVDRLKKGDLKESMTCAYDPWVDEDGAGDAVPKLLIRESLWPNPADAPRFRPAMEAYRAACLKLMRRLIKIVALAMGEKKDFFSKKITYPIAGIRALFYPPQDGGEEEETGLGAHTDVQLMTMIAQTPYDISALQVLNAAGEWISPIMEPETFVVNLGDMMGRLTNDMYLSTIHRVKNKDSRGRYSLPFFFGLSNDELISTLPQFVTEENPLKEGYEKAMTGYEHYNVRMQRAHHKHASAVDKVDTSLPYGMTKIDGMLVEGM